MYAQKRLTDKRREVGAARIRIVGRSEALQSEVVGELVELCSCRNNVLTRHHEHHS